MTRRSVVLITAIAALIGTGLVSALPAAAYRSRAADPTTINPVSLRLPPSSLPVGSVMDHDAVSDNPDADARTTPPDGQVSRFAPPIHHDFYEVLGRLTGYRQDFRFTVNGNVEVGTEYLASIYPDAAKAQAAVDDIVGPTSVIQLVLGKPLTPQCTTGDFCASYWGPNPLHPGYNAVFAVFRRGPITVETGSEIADTSFDAARGTAQTQLYALLDTADKQIQSVLNAGGSPATAAPTATPQPTSAPPPPPAKKTCPKNSRKKSGKCVCKKGYTMKKGKCIKKK